MLCLVVFINTFRETKREKDVAMGGRDVAAETRTESSPAERMLQRPDRGRTGRGIQGPETLMQARRR